jgi:Recombinase
VPDETTAWVVLVREMFERYAGGGWSVRKVVTWLNADPRVPQPPRRPRWTADTVLYMLRNHTYKGFIRYNPIATASMKHRPRAASLSYRGSTSRWSPPRSGTRCSAD